MKSVFVVEILRVFYVVELNFKIFFNQAWHFSRLKLRSVTVISVWTFLTNLYPNFKTPWSSSNWFWLITQHSICQYMMNTNGQEKKHSFMLSMYVVSWRWSAMAFCSLLCKCINPHAALSILQLRWIRQLAEQVEDMAFPLCQTLSNRWTLKLQCLSQRPCFRKAFPQWKCQNFQRAYKLKSQIKQHVTIPSRVNSSFLTRIRIGFLIKQEVTSSTSEGIVADNKMTWKQNHHFAFKSPKRNKIFNIQINRPENRS
jgi:hypothetical protein